MSHPKGQNNNEVTHRQQATTHQQAAKHQKARDAQPCDTYNLPDQQPLASGVRRTTTATPHTRLDHNTVRQHTHTPRNNTERQTKHLTTRGAQARDTYRLPARPLASAVRRTTPATPHARLEHNTVSDSTHTTEQDDEIDFGHLALSTISL